MNPEGLAPAIPAGERPQTHALDYGATGIGPLPIITSIKLFIIHYTSDRSILMQRR
jgi:hypothetical protein